MQDFKAFKSCQFLRLGFHDCLKYKEGAPKEGGFDGCDGCLNSHFVGKNLKEYKKKYLYSDLKYTSNNGLLSTVDILEQVYTNNTFLNEFLNNKQLDGEPTMKEKNYSRADLWAFATMLGFEHGVKENNLACEGEWNNGRYHIPLVRAPP